MHPCAVMACKAQSLFTFGDLGLSTWIERNLRTLGILQPTDIQQRCIPPILEGRDVLAAAQTGSGKTAAFALPILERLQTDPYGVFAVCLTPTRELAIQLTEQFSVFCGGTSLKCETIIGGDDVKVQAQRLASRPHIVCATPGRLMEHFVFDESNSKNFSKVSTLVLDEADRLLDPGFDAELRIILSKLPKQRQTLLFSATMTQSISAMKDMNLHNVFHVDLHNCQPVDKCKQCYCFVPANVKEAYLVQVLSHFLARLTASMIVFTNSIKTCELLHQICVQLGIESVSLHSLKKQKQRQESLERFRSQRVPILFATDVASRGIDIPAVEVIINYDPPRNVSDYVHRIGRTARAERSGEAVTLVTQHDVGRFLAIEKGTTQRMEQFELNEQNFTSSLTRVIAAKRSARLAMTQDFDSKLTNQKREEKRREEKRREEKKR